MNVKKVSRLRRAKRVRAKIRELKVNRLCVYRSPRHIYAQVISPDNKVVLKAVVIGRDYGNKVELSSGLEASDRLIESPPDGVSDGDAVKIAPATPAKKP